ncbi:MAG: DUF3795 domain-containing protein [Parachlamydiales bacterium]|jgi:hypothetical protein
MTEKLKSSCGLDCAMCPAFIAYQTNDDKLREQTAIEWGKNYNHPFKKEMINCAGCLSKKDPHIGHCEMCSIRNCAKIKKIKYCYKCLDFDFCDVRKDFESQSGLNIKQISEN